MAGDGRPFFLAPILAAALLAAAGTVPGAETPPHDAAGDGPRALLVRGDPGAHEVRGIACASGRPIAVQRFASPLSAGASVAADGRAAFVATTDGALTRLELPSLRPSASVRLPAAATSIAAAAGPDAIVLAGASGTEPLSALDAATLAPAQRYRVDHPATVSAILDLPLRRRMAVAFADLAQVWEIAYHRDAPPVLRGLVHDYRSGEWVALPGRLTPRAVELRSPTRWLAPGGAASELARGDAAGGVGIVNLEVRREIERPALPGAGPPLLAAWSQPGGRGWVAADPPGRLLAVLHAPGWRLETNLALDTEPVALATVRAAPGGAAPRPAGGDPVQAATTVLALHGGAGRWTLSAVDPIAGTVRALGSVSGPAVDGAPRLAAAADGRCVAVLDATGRWLGAWLAQRETFVARDR